MFEQSTTELEKILENTAAADAEQYLEKNRKEMTDGRRSFMEYMTECFRKHGISKQDVILGADIPLGYGYKLLEEEKHTVQRDIILRLCYAGGLSLAETQKALKLYHMNTLYARTSRDAIIIICFNERPGGIIEVNRFLTDNHMSPLRSSGVQD